MRELKPFKTAILPILLMSMFNIPLADATSPPEQKLPIVVGGWTSIAVDDRVRSAARYAVRQLHIRGARLSKIGKVELQVVAGTNFRIDLTLTDKSRWRVVVFERLNGTFEMISADKLRKARVKKG